MADLNEWHLITMEELKHIRSDINKENADSRLVLLYFLLFIAVILTTLSYLLYRSVEKRVNEIVFYALDIVEDKDAKDVPRYTRDELDIVLKSLEQMQNRVKRLKTDLKYKDENKDAVYQNLQRKIHSLNKELEEAKAMIDKSIIDKKQEIKDTIDEFKQK